MHPKSWTKKTFGGAFFNMTKYTIETKKALVELVNEKKYSTQSAASELGVSKQVAKRWMKLYEFHGNEGLVMKRRTYSGEFKIGVVEYMHKNNLSVSEASAQYRIPSDATLLKWERIYYEEGAQGLMIDKRGRPRKNMSKKPKETKMTKDTKEDLIAEVQRLRAENAYLKKYNALVQKKKDLEAARKRK